MHRLNLDRTNRTKRRYNVLINALIALALLAGAATAGDDNASAAARVAADKWLVLVDRGDYEASWKEASRAFRTGITLEKWEQALRTDREPEGRLSARKYMGSEIQPAPAGSRSVMIRYAGSFQNRRSAVERVWTRLDKDGQWRVTGYVITAASPDPRSVLMALVLLFVIIAVWVMELKPKRNAMEQ